jgi:ATP-binding protein involved in chromosome partitioning
MPLTQDQVFQQLRSVYDPYRRSDIVSLNLVRNVAYCNGHASIHIHAAGIEAPARAKLQQAIETAVRAMGPDIQAVRVEFETTGVGPPGPHRADPPPFAPSPAASSAPPKAAPPPAPPRPDNPLPGVRRILAVGAGKGGVGKSTVAVNLAVGLARLGRRVGLLDADIYGPSAPTLLGLGDLPLGGSGSVVYPFEVHGVKAMTIGKMVEPDKPLIWRGPMAHGAFRQLATQTLWGELDDLVIDLPPGTGDVPLTMAQMLPLSGAVIVCTPQKVAQDDAVRAVAMFRQLGVPVLGVVENMSYFVGDDGKEYDLFGKGGAAAMAGRLGLPVLGRIPIHMELRANSDAGDPTANFTGNPALARELESLTRSVVDELTARAAEPAGPTLNVS